ncbi:flagellar hook-length control protein FliK [Telluria mixta]|uniref:Flagellar hook-length control protein FliK n=1 Tax=Telluria mixta TaxID=34071 RepID=A0ABT2C5N2_9BURK|nr:flagellar hook-length control protein FliK [Telluria mixta]MCS0632688.1 flagellar hook-length control protein FliK [Telluria mixta]WEM99017.1 flagellar hook-length control protein FliK [Telluria mixta]
MLPRDSVSLTQVAATRPALPVGDPRQQAFARALANLVGQSMPADVLTKLPDGSFVVRINDMAARMPLPQGTQVGTQVPLTLVTVAPRPTFQVQTGQGAPAFAEAGPPLPEGASPQESTLAYLEGKDAAALTRTAALLAGARGLAQLPGGAADGANASISTAGKMLGDVIAAAQKAETQASAAVGRTPLLGGPSGDAGAIAQALKDGLGKSGLFYESHVAEWAAGARPRADLAAEPQARGMPPPTDPNTAQFINLQLNAHEQGRVAWQGQLWPGRDMQWDVERDASSRQDGEDENGGTWQSSLRLRFGALGEVGARVVLSGGQLHIRLDARDESVKGLLDAHRARLADALDAAGTPLSTLTIHDDGQG